MKKTITIIMLCLPFLSFSQNSKDSLTLNQDAVFNRPFIQGKTSRTAVGGYMEANSNYKFEDGLAENFSMEFRRFNLFLYSSIASRIKFLAELEFEHGTSEIALETAMLDFKLRPDFNIRAGIILPAIGIFNANHDSPNWEFVDRPLSSTMLIPSTLSEVGFGFHGKSYFNKWIFAYQVYAVNGLNDDITSNSEGMTSLDAGKRQEMFAEDNNGVPMFNGRIAIGNWDIGEMGLSYYGGTYNTYLIEGIEVDKKRQMNLLSIDYNLQIKKLNIQGEYAWLNLETQNHSLASYATQQSAGFVDFVYPILQRKIFQFSNSIVNASIRLEQYDLNKGTFGSTSKEIGNEGRRIGIGLSFRPVPGTVIRANYYQQKSQDFLANPFVTSGAYQVGVASYF